MLREGEGLPPIDVFRVGELYFVRDGHHRVSVAIALRLRTIDAYVTEVLTRVDATGIAHRGDLIAKDLRRVFLDRVPLPGPALCTILVCSPWSYAVLSETVEAWGFRLMQQEDRYLDRATVARRWYAEEFQPVVRMLHAADLVGEQHRRRGLPRPRLPALPADAHPPLGRRGGAAPAASARRDH